MGMDPLRWVAGCAVKVDLTTVVYPALRRLRPLLRELGVIVAEREDADIFTAGREEPTISRRIYNLRDPKIDREDLKRINPERAISLVQVHQREELRPIRSLEIFFYHYTIPSHLQSKNS